MIELAEISPFSGLKETALVSGSLSATQCDVFDSCSHCRKAATFGRD